MESTPVVSSFSRSMAPAVNHILAVDDDEDILELVRYTLTKQGYLVSCAHSGSEAIEEAKKGIHSLVLLDLMMPGIDGLEVCKALRSNEVTKDLPIVMLTAKGEESDIVTGLELGADDYITKPFSNAVLAARVKTVLRRKNSEPVDEDALVRIHELVIHPGRHEVFVGDNSIQLTATEFRLLLFLARRPGWVFTRYQIVDAVKGSDYAVTDRSVDVQVVGLRRKLGDAGAYIETVRGVGYRFKEQFLG